MAKVGRPTKYKPEYCEMVIEHMSEGFSVESFAALVDTHKQTIYNWMQEHPEFLDAIKIGYDKSRLWWEIQGMNGLWSTKAGSFNSSNYIFQMKNRFREEWRDKQEHDHSSSDGSMQPVINIIKPKDE